MLVIKCVIIYVVVSVSIYTGNDTLCISILFPLFVDGENLKVFYIITISFNSDENRHIEVLFATYTAKDRCSV